MEKKNKKATVIIISIFIVVILAILISYAYFSTQLSGTDQIVKVGELELVLDETSEGISLDNAIGISDSEGMSSTPSTFELRNNGNKAVDYIIYLDDNTISDTDTRIDDKYLKYNLNKSGANSGATLLTRIGANPNRVLDSGTIEGGETNKYSLNLWITDEVDGNYSGQVFSGKLRVEVSQEREKEVATVLLNNIPEENINTEDKDQTFITGSNPNNYIWYSGNLWRAVSIDSSDNSVKLVTSSNISSIPYDDDSSAFEGSYIEEWLNDTSVDGFLGNLRQPEKFIKMNSKWNASQMADNSKPPREEEGGTIVEDTVGLLNYYEFGKISEYINDKRSTYLLTPYDSTNIWYFYQNSILNFSISDKSNNIQNPGIKASINLKPEIKVVDGDGSEDNPYRLEGDNDKNLKGTKLNTRYSGEYISFGVGENNLYRIVSHEFEGLTKITSASVLKENGENKTIGFNSNYPFSKIYSVETSLGSFLNNEFLDNYLAAKQRNMVEKDSIWYLGELNNGENYKLTKYADINMTGYTSDTVIATVGLLRAGELMAGGGYYNVAYWLITPINNNISVRLFNGNGTLYQYNIINSFAIKPALNLKSNVIISSGDGTKNNPFTLELG